MADPLETYRKICFEAARECGPEPKMASVEAAVRKRISALPPEERDAIDQAVELITSFSGPGFHEKGPH